MLYGKVLRSPHPHARILRVNADRALARAGVRAVVFGKDTPGIQYGTIPDEYPLAIHKVRYIGDEVARREKNTEGLIPRRAPEDLIQEYRAP